jgi:hypothetical protein
LTSTSTHDFEVDGDVEVDSIVVLDLDHFGLFLDEDSLN